MLKQVLIGLARKTGILKRLNWHLRRLNYRRRIYINGVMISSPTLLGITCEQTEPWIIELLDRLLKEKGGAFLDVGVNVGQTLIKLKALDPGRRYIGFEPNPTCVFYVRELIEENGFQGCTVLPVGLFTRDAVLSLDMFSNDRTDSSASLISGYRPNNKIYSQMFVPVCRFESVANLLDVDKVGVIKIDVEGAELEVVKSLSGLIRSHRPIILLEVLPVYSNENASRKARQEELELIFADAEYTMFRVRKTSTDQYAGLQQLESIGVHSDLSQCDYVIVPNEQSARLEAAAKVPAKPL
jgi:FkbM family methyltransferase